MNYELNALKTRNVMVTPAEAEMMLRTNIENNRNVRRTKVRQFADAMRKGQWELNGETIKITPEGRLIDGQHRLHACVMSGASFPVQIVCGVPETSYATIDGGSARTAGDSLSHAAIQNANHAAAAVRWIEGIRNRAMDRGGIKLSPADVLKFYQDNPDLEQSVSIGAKYAKIAGFCRGPMISAFHFIFARSRGKMEANRFVIDLCEGSSLSPNDPVLLLRNALIKNASSIKARKHDGEILAWVINAWNARIDGRDISVIRGSVVNDDGTRRLPNIR